MKNSQIHSKDKDWDSSERGKEWAAQFSFQSPRKTIQITPFQEFKLVDSSMSSHKLPSFSSANCFTNSNIVSFGKNEPLD